MTMLRYNAGKEPLSLIPTSFIEAIFNTAYELGAETPTTLVWQVGQVLDFGANKYAAHNWRKGGSWSSVMNSALRHLMWMVDGRRVDPESDLPEAGHLGCNIAFLLEFATLGVGEDDRFITPEQGPDLAGDPRPSLVWVLDALLAFRDGGEIEALRVAAWELARWVESDRAASQPATPPAAEPFMAEVNPTQIKQEYPPFGFPSFPCVDPIHISYH